MMEMTEKMCGKLALEHQETPWVYNKSFEDILFTRSLGFGAQGMGITTDVMGIKWLLKAGEPGAMPINSSVEDAVIKDVENWEQYVKFPDLDKIDWQAWAEKETASWDRENRMSSVCIGEGFMELFENLAGMEASLCALIEEEEAVMAYNEAMADYLVRAIERIAKYYKPDRIFMHDDYANQLSLMISRERWQRMYKPYLKKVVDAVHGLGMYYEHHSCGKVAELFDDFVDIGVDATNPVQFTNNPYELQKKYEDSLTLIGCSDKQAFVDNPNATPEQIEAHLREIVETMSKRRSFIAHIFFMDPSRTPIWAKVIDDINKPLYEKAGVKPRLMMDLLK